MASSGRAFCSSSLVPPTPAREDEYNEWYTNTHIPDVCAVPGFVAARRYKVRDTGRGTADQSAPTYVAIYEIESDDLAEPMNDLAARAAVGRVRRSHVLQTDPPPVVTLYELIE